MTSDSRNWKICGDVIMTQHDGMLQASNHRAREHVLLSLPAVNYLLGGEFDGPVEATELSRFSNLDGLLADPTRLIREEQPPAKRFDSEEELLGFLKSRFIVIDDEAAYDSYFQEKSSILDRKHFGTFHQQVGAEVRLRLRQDPDRWWYEQKFDPETGEFKDNLYKYVQEEFLSGYLPSLELDGKIILDFGCGSGMAARRFLALGAKVIGLDPDQELLAKADQSTDDRFTPVHMNLGSDNPLAGLPETKVDMIWMSDVFMFYFHPLDGGSSTTAPKDILAAATRNLKPDGKCIIMQPHASFWLAPWLGREDRPFTVISEYSSRLYSVTPSLSDLSAAIRDAGLVIEQVFEPTAQKGQDTDPRAFHFAHNFPLWWVFECRSR
jgi:SAM-dependent methyltransferase